MFFRCSRVIRLLTLASACNLAETVEQMFMKTKIILNHLPKSFPDVSLEISKPSTFIDNVGSLSLSTRWNILGFAFKEFIFIHLMRILDSFYNWLNNTVGMFSPHEKGELSSAKLMMSKVMKKNRSLEKILYSVGPKTEPWGTPYDIFNWDDFLFLMVTFCLLSPK